MQISIEKTIKTIENLDKKLVLFKLSNNLLRILYRSEEVPNIFGYTSNSFDEIINNDPYSFVSAYDIDYLKNGFSRIRNSNEKYPFTIQVKHSNGELMFLSGIATYLCDEDEETFFICVLSNDYLSKNPKSMDQLKTFKDTDRYKKAIDFGGIVTWDYIIKTKRIINENGIKELYNFSFNNISIPESIPNSGLIDKDDIPEYLEFYRKVTSGTNDELIREGWYHFPGLKAPKYIRVKYIIEFDENNLPKIAHGMSLDLTESKNAEMAFDLRANAFLNMNPDTLLTFQIDISDNMVKASTAAFFSLKDLTLLDSSDELVASLSHKITTQSDKIRFINMFSRGSLLSSFNNGQFNVNLEHPFLIKNDREVIVRTNADLIKNPVTGNIEAVITIVNINYAKTIEHLVNGTVQREYDYIALAYIKTDTFFLLDKYNDFLHNEKSSFINTFTERFKESINSEDELEYVLSEFNYKNLVEKINDSGQYTIQYNTDDNYDKNKHKILTFSFLNNSKDIITISCHDTTKLFNEELLQKKKLSDALVLAEKANIAKSDFLSLISHDIRTPLNGIMGMNQLALNENNIENIKKYLDKMQTSSEFLLGLLNNVLDMSKIEAGKIELKDEPYSFKEFNDYIESVIRPICLKKNQNFKITNNDNNVSLIVDKLRLNQVIFNILTNACKYTDESGNISLDINIDKINSTRLVATYKITDDGIGMTPEFLSHIFESFSQENRANMKITEGAGLGMAITYNLVNIMGGDISVESEVNKGSTFRIVFNLPYIEESEENNFDKNISSEIINVDFTNKVFLLCEDNEINQEIASSILQNVGARVEIAADGMIGVNMYKEAKASYYDCIFMDIRMPNMDGITATKEIRKSRKKDSKTIPIIAMTANAMSDDKMECVEAGMSSFIAKPINIQQLYKLMNQLIK